MLLPGGGPHRHGQLGPRRDDVEGDPTLQAGDVDAQAAEALGPQGAVSVPQLVEGQRGAGQDHHRAGQVVGPRGVPARRGGHRLDRRRCPGGGGRPGSWWARRRWPARSPLPRGLARKARATVAPFSSSPENSTATSRMRRPGRAGAGPAPPGWRRSQPLVSAAPRPYSRPSRSTRRWGGAVYPLFAGTVSMWALSSRRGAAPKRASTPWCRPAVKASTLSAPSAASSRREVQRQRALVPAGVLRVEGDQVGQPTAERVLCTHAGAGWGGPARRSTRLDRRSRGPLR